MSDVISGEIGYIKSCANCSSLEIMISKETAVILPSFVTKETMPVLRLISNAL